MKGFFVGWECFSLQGIRGLKNYFINLDQIEITNEKSNSS